MTTSRLASRLILMTQYSQQHSSLVAARAAGLTANELWLYYFSVGGNLDVFQLDAYIHGAYVLPVHERNIVALALNELTDDLPQCPRAEFVNNPCAE